MSDFKFELGVELKDKITGFRGIVTARIEHLTGCNRYVLQPRKVSKDGKVIENNCFDEDQLIKVGQGVNLEVKNPGGPQSSDRFVLSARR